MKKLTSSQLQHWSAGLLAVILLIVVGAYWLRTPSGDAQTSAKNDARALAGWTFPW